MAKKTPSPAAVHLADLVDTIRSRAATLDRWYPGRGDDLRRRTAAVIKEVLAETDLSGNRKVESERRTGTE